MSIFNDRRTTMNVEEFYDKLKNALNFFNLTWGDKELASVYIDGDFFVISYADEEVRFAVPKTGE